MELPRTPVFSQKPSLKPERESIDPPTHPNTWTGAKAHYIHLQSQSADPSNGLSPKPSYWQPGRSRTGCPGPAPGSQGLAELMRQLSEPPRCMEASNSCFASLGTSCLRFPVLHPAPLSSPGGAAPLPLGEEAEVGPARIQRWVALRLVPGAWCLVGAPACSLSAFPCPGGPGGGSPSGA